MEEGKALDEAKIKEAIEAKRLKFISLAQTEVTRPKAAFVISNSGGS